MAFKKVGDFKGIVPQDFQGLDDFNECADVNFFLYFFFICFLSTGYCAAQHHCAGRQ